MTRNIIFFYGEKLHLHINFLNVKFSGHEVIRELQISFPSCPFLVVLRNAGRSIIGGGGGGHIFIYSCSQTVKTIDFKILISISKEINWA